MILKLSFCDLALLRLRGVGRDRALIKFQMVGERFFGKYQYNLFKFYTKLTLEVELFLFLFLFLLLFINFDFYNYNSLLSGHSNYNHRRKEKSSVSFAFVLSLFHLIWGDREKYKNRMRIEVFPLLPLWPLLPLLPLLPVFLFL